MNNKEINTDKFTKELISRAGIQEPNVDFTKNVMSKILKDPSIKISFITKDDNNSSLWLVISMSIMFVGLSAFYFIKNGYSLASVSEGLQKPSYVNVFTDLFSKFTNELSLSPYILIALIGVLILVIIDKTIIKYLYSI